MIIIRYKLKDILFANVSEHWTIQHSCMKKFYVTNNQLAFGYCSNKLWTSLDWSCCRSQQVARQVVGSLLLRLPPAGTSGDQRDTTCATIGQFAGRSKRQHIARSKRVVPTVSHFSRLNRGDQHAHVRKIVHHTTQCVILKKIEEHGRRGGPEKTED